MDSGLDLWSCLARISEALPSNRFRSQDDEGAASFFDELVVQASAPPPQGSSEEGEEVGSESGASYSDKSEDEEDDEEEGAEANGRRLPFQAQRYVRVCFEGSRCASGQWVRVLGRVARLALEPRASMAQSAACHHCACLGPRSVASTAWMKPARTDRNEALDLVDERFEAMVIKEVRAAVKEKGPCPLASDRTRSTAA